MHGNAKEQTEIAEEKELLDTAIVKAMEKDRFGEITKEELQKQVDNMAGENKVTIGTVGKGLGALFIESNRYYEIDADGNLSDYQIASYDPNPGDITKDIDGNTLDGSIEKPFEINCIEDLVAFSNMTNGTGIKIEDGKAVEITSSNDFKEKYVVLKRTLNFESFISYANSRRTDFGDINGNTEDGNTLITEMTTGTGFRPVCDFHGSFDGNNNEIQNLYINTERKAGLFVSSTSWAGKIKKIKNLGITGNVTSTNSDAAGICSICVEEGIENCWNKANVTSRNATYTEGVGGGGYNIKNCYNEGNIIAEKGIVGGICAGSGITIENCYNTGNITGKEWYTGGIISGHANGLTTVINCYNTGEITGNFATGGIIGTSGTATNCYNTGKVTTSENGGGIVGSGAQEIYNCYNTGEIKGNYVGGITLKTSKKIVNCYNIGNVQGGRVGRNSRS